MAISVVSDLTEISSCDLTTSGGTHYRLNGTNTGNPAADTDAYIQGTGCIANKMGTTTGTTDTGGHFNSTATFDITNKHLFHWRQIVTAGNMLAKASRGICVGLTNTSTTSTTAWSTTNYKLWFLDGNDTIPFAVGWIPYVLDPASTADASAGTLTLTTVKNVGMICRQNSTVTTTVSNQFYDVIRMGTGLTATTSAGGDTITLQSIYDVDKINSNSWGIVTQSASVFYGSARITVGSASQTNVCNFTDADQVLIWRNQKVSATLYTLELLGAASFLTTFQLTSSVIRGQSSKAWRVTCNESANFKLYSCSISNMSSAALTSGSILQDTSFTACGTIDTAGATINGCAFKNGTATQLKIDSTSEMGVVSSSTFTSAGTGYAIELTVAGTYTFSGLTFTNYAVSNGSTGNEAVFVNVASGSVTINITNNGNTPSIRTAGATVTVVNSKTFVVNNIVDGSEVRIVKQSDLSELAGAENVGASPSGLNNVTVAVDPDNAGRYKVSYSYGYTVDTPIYVVVFKETYGALYISSLLKSTDSTLSTFQIKDRQYI